MAIEFTEKWACGSCGELHDSTGSAEDCCHPEPELRFVCSECNENFSSDLLVLFHIEDHTRDENGQLPEEIYLDELRFGKPPIGAWVMEMEARTEFLIPIED